MRMQTGGRLLADCHPGNAAGGQSESAIRGIFEFNLVTAGSQIGPTSVRRQRPSPQLSLRHIRPYPIVGLGPCGGYQPGAGYSAGMATRGEKVTVSRFASSFGIAEVSTTTPVCRRKGLSRRYVVLPCDCKGVFPRLRPAVDFPRWCSPRRRWPPSLFLSRSGRSVRRHYDRRVCMVPAATTPVMGFAWATMACWHQQAETRHRIPLPWYAFMAFSRAPE